MLCFAASNGNWLHKAVIAFQCLSIWLMTVNVAEFYQQLQIDISVISFRGHKTPIEKRKQFVVAEVLLHLNQRAITTQTISYLNRSLSLLVGNCTPTRSPSTSYFSRWSNLANTFHCIWLFISQCYTDHMFINADVSLDGMWPSTEEIIDIIRETTAFFFCGCRYDITEHLLALKYT